MGPGDAARLLNVGPSTIQRWIDSGELPAHKTLGGHRRMSIEDLQAFACSKNLPIGRVPAAAPVRALLVDDEADVLASLTVRLRGLAPGLEILTATSGFEAGFLVSRHHPRLVLLDIRMPGLDGIQVCRIIKGDPETRATHVVGLTASRDPRQIDALREAGAEQVIGKPYEVSELRELLDRLFPELASRGAPLLASRT